MTCWCSWSQQSAIFRVLTARVVTAEELRSADIITVTTCCCLDATLCSTTHLGPAPALRYVSILVSGHSAALAQEVQHLRVNGPTDNDHTKFQKRRQPFSTGGKSCPPTETKHQGRRTKCSPEGVQSHRNNAIAVCSTPRAMQCHTLSLPALLLTKHYCCPCCHKYCQSPQHW